MMNDEAYELKQKCLEKMKEVCDKFADEAHALHNCPRDEFQMIVLEQWRPW